MRAATYLHVEDGNYTSHGVCEGVEMERIEGIAELRSMLSEMDGRGEMV
jgi:hypothetical protein